MADNKPRTHKAKPDHYTARVAKAKDVGWPTSFMTDLTTHDRATLAQRQPGMPFLWVLRESGTHLVLPSTGPIDGRGHMAWEVPSFIANAFGAGCCLWFWWTGDRLVPVRDQEEAARRLRAAVTCSREGCKELIHGRMGDGWYCSGECRNEAESAYAAEG